MPFAFCCGCVAFFVVLVMGFVAFHNLPFAVVIGGVGQIPSVSVSYLCLSRCVVVVPTNCNVLAAARGKGFLDLLFCKWFLEILMRVLRT